MYTFSAAVHFKCNFPSKVTFIFLTCYIVNFSVFPRIEL